ncbi:GATOR2 complex protein WDR24-like [Dysidea avara]|uniref:GATOR2 complex protein WDR24-like n=1 Tax=Dysidea avara TaxID=196820 RepID=UPI003325502A
MPMLSLEQSCSTLGTNERPNREATMAAVAGRKVFKIVNLSSDQLSVHMDLRDLPIKSLNLNYGCQDVHWNPKEDHLLASAPNNGSIVLWNLHSRAAKNKIEHVFKDIHQRAVNKICWHLREFHLLISGSQDCTMQTIDIRTKQPVQRFNGVDSVRDVKICPHPYPRDMQFAVSYDNGTVQIWDRRYPDSALKSIQVHSGPAYSCSWHPDADTHWLASAGRDKSIKILELQANVSRPREVHSIYGMSSVARVKWRPSHKYHIASCSQILDNMVAVWDIRRSYIPLASFMSHSDDVTAFAWLNDTNILSCSKDGKLIYEGIQDTIKPAEKATPVGLSISSDDNVAHACGDYVTHRSHNSLTSSNNHGQYAAGSWRPFTFRKQTEDIDPLTASQPAFLDVNSTLREYIQYSKKTPKRDCFVTMATSYKLQGVSLHEICEHNYKVAEGLGKRGVAQTWRILSRLYCDNHTDFQHLGFLPPQSGLQSQLSSRVFSANSVESDNIQPSKDGAGDTTRPSTAKETVLSAGGSIADDEGSESASSGNDIDETLDFHDDYGDEFGDERDSDVAAASSTSHNITDWELPAEPFMPRQKRPSPDLISAESASQSAHGSTEAGKTSRLVDALAHHHHQQQQALLFPHWNFHQIVVNMLYFYAEKGDVQTSVSVLLVLQDVNLQKKIDPALMELWFSTYIDLLKRKQLWKQAALVIKLCPLEEISGESQNSTVMINNCGHCHKSLPSSGWNCERCEKLTNHCSVCHSTVQGLYTSCQTCGHGGHLYHMTEWYRQSKMCPSGCGHVCIT